MNELLLNLASKSGLNVESWMTNPPKPFQILGSIEQFEKFIELLEKEIEAKHFSAGYKAGHSDGLIDAISGCIDSH